MKNKPFNIYSKMSELDGDFREHLRMCEDGGSYYITPEMYGAVGDGVADDSDALENAIFNSNGKIILLSKKYRITRKITVDTACYINGTSGVFPNAKTENENDCMIISEVDDFFLVANGYCQLENIHIVGKNRDCICYVDTPLSNSCGIDLNMDFVIKNVWFENFGYIAMRVRSVYRSMIEKCTFKNNHIGLQFTAETTGGWAKFSCTSVRIANCYFSRNYYGIKNEENIPSSIINCEIDTCVITWNSYGIYAKDLRGIILNSWFEQNSIYAIYSKDGVFVDFGNRYETDTDIIYNQQTDNVPYVQQGATLIKGNKVSSKYFEFTQKGHNEDELKLILQKRKDSLGTKLSLSGGSDEVNMVVTSSMMKIIKSYYNTKYGEALTPYFNSDDNNFTFTKLSTGKYHVSFGRIMNSPLLIVEALPQKATPSDLNTIDTTYIRQGFCIGVNSKTDVGFNKWNKCDGVVIITTDINGELVDSNFILTVGEEFRFN